MRRFVLYRFHDVSGVSGIGPVADGVMFEDGSIALRWRGDNSSTAVWDNEEKLINVHGHNGSTEIRFIDPPYPLLERVIL
jgi:hypothetical protein